MLSGYAGQSVTAHALHKLLQFVVAVAMTREKPPPQWAITARPNGGDLRHVVCRARQGGVFLFADQPRRRECSAATGPHPTGRCCGMASVCTANRSTAATVWHLRCATLFAASHSLKQLGDIHDVQGRRHKTFITFPACTVPYTPAAPGSRITEIVPVHLL